MSGHTERAEELVAKARQELKMLLNMTENSLYDTGSAEMPERAEVRWMRLQAIQNQAQIHATLALNENLSRNG